jgi:hypothetical protein
MSTISDFPARGKVIRLEDSAIIFIPAKTNYELKLITAGRYDGPIDTSVEAIISASARKLWTVPSGGNFIAPIFGPPRIAQGRIKFLDQTMMVVHAGVNLIIKLPSIESGFDLNTGAVSVGALVNATLLPGTSFQLATAVVAG